MTQPQALTTQQIQNYQSQIQNAGTLAQQKAAAIAVYQDLYAKGYSYAGWALGVATGNTITGTAALDYLTGTALMAISPGMNVTAEIKTGKRRIIEYLISPIERARHESLRER